MTLLRETRIVSKYFLQNLKINLRNMFYTSKFRKKNVSCNKICNTYIYRRVRWRLHMKGDLYIIIISN